MKFNLEIIKPSQASVEFNKFICIVRIINKLDQTNTAEFDFIITTLIKGGLKRLLLDLEELRYVDSSGIGKLINITKNIRKMEGDLIVTKCSSHVMEVFKLVHLEKFVQICNTNEEALTNLRLA